MVARVDGNAVGGIVRIRFPTLGIVYRLLLLAGVGVLAETYRRVRIAEAAQRRQEPGDARVQADALVVFGGQCYPRGPGLEVCDRLNHALWLWHRGVAPTILVSGGIDDTVDEVEIMAAYLRDHGVPEQAIGEARPGDNSRATISSLRPDRTYVAVSSAYHAHRIASEARRQGKHVVVDCAPDSIDLRNKRVLRVRRAAEVAGCVMYAAPERVAVPARAAVGRLRHDIPGLFTPQ